MKTITIKGKTRKGKNRVHELGNLWFLIREKDGKWLIESIKSWHKDGKKASVRWIKPIDDPDFEVIDVCG